MNDVVVVGSINLDLIATVARHPSPGETLLALGASESPGGKGANQAVAAARRGASTVMVGAVGSDGASTTAVATLAEAGVDISRVAHRPGPTGLAIITVARDGENTIVVVPGANATVNDAQVQSAADAIAGSSVAVVQAELPIATVEHAIALAGAHGTRVVLNAAPATAFALASLRRADPLVVNEHEAGIVLGAAMGAPPPPDPLDTALALRALGVPSVVVTLGSEGCLGVDESGPWTVPARPVAAVDTTGAGDAFVGALAAALARGTTLRDAATEATRVAAYSVQHPGAQPSYPTTDKELP
ncbi:ribokinase [Demequina silvatica]|uniref:ribokinase n=1 Tax=Demequina silvatica TaxID=1638988 RepID=UPI0007863FD9|nr:ribokinase [Demequina silvatica]